MVKNKKVMFWGASIFIKNFLKKYNIKSTNIIGLIDKDCSKKGQKYSNYSIYSPEDIHNLSPDVVIISIINFSYERQQEIKNYIKTNHNKNVKIIAI